MPLSIQLTLPDLWQADAVRALKAGRDVILDAPTGAGKTFVFEQYAKGGVKGGQAIYTVPTRALANDKRAEWREKGWNVGIATGDVAEDLDAPVIVATLETQRERLIQGRGPALLAVDEYQLIADRARGLNYELALALAPPSTQLLLLSGSVANPDDVAAWLRRLGREVDVVRTAERPVPLDELGIEQFPYPVPKEIQGFWPRLAVGTLMADAGPLLIFAPQRSGAEKIARKIAGVLPPANIRLTPPQASACGKELAAMIARGVAFHHSGLPYAARAGAVEPLAKAGQLRVVVATMGLAAGINFSTRSVMIADTRYFDGPYERIIAPDELLQMFGRAGRRGLDEVGFAVVTKSSPRLLDAAPKRLRRANEIDWPTLIRVMRAAAERGANPFDAARDLCGSLFSEQRIVLGFSGAAPAQGATPAAGKAMFGLGATKTEVRDSTGAWVEFRTDRVRRAPLGQAMHRGKPANRSAKLIESAFSIGRVCRIPLNGEGGGSGGSGDFHYGREVALARETRRGSGEFMLTHLARRAAGAKKADRFDAAEVEALVAPAMAPHLEGGSGAGIVRRGPLLCLQVDFSGAPIECYADDRGALLADPETREQAAEGTPDLVDPESGEEFRAQPGTAAFAWRKLDLIGKSGSPTRRGAIFSFFQGGEGLAIAAALEDPTYPPDEIADHLANLRGGHRFDRDGSESESARLAVCCRSAFGTVDYEGYLELGLPPNFGEGAAEAIADYYLGKKPLPSGIDADFGQGDVERAFSEWVSLLRHLSHAPDFDWDRWRALKLAASDRLQRFGKSASLAATLPEVPADQRRRPPTVRVTARDLRG